MKKITIFLIILYFSISNCFAIVENKKISLSEAIELTLNLNPNVKIELLNTEISKNNINIANKLNNPSIGTFQNMGTVGKTEPQQIGADYVVEILKRGKRKDYAKIKAKISDNNRKFYEYNLIADVKKTYIDLLLKKTNLKIIKEQADLARELYENLEADFKKGKTPKTEAIQAKIAYNRALMYLNIANSEVISAQNRFNIVLNTKEINYDTKEDSLENNFDSLFTLNPNKTLPDFETILNYALEKREDLIKAKSEIEAAKENLKIVKSQLIPDLELSGGWGYQTKGYNSDKRFESGAFASLNLVNVPLIYRYQPEIKNAQIEIEKAQLNFENAKIDVIRDVSDAYEKFIISKNNLNFYDSELLNNSKELLFESKKSLNKNEIDMTNFLVSKKLYLELILGYETALSEYYISFAELLKEMNCDFKEIETL